MFSKSTSMLLIFNNPAKESHSKIKYPKMPGIRNPWILRISLVLIELYVSPSFEPLTRLHFIWLLRLILEGALSQSPQVRRFFPAQATAPSQVRVGWLWHLGLSGFKAITILFSKTEGLVKVDFFLLSSLSLCLFPHPSLPCSLGPVSLLPDFTQVDQGCTRGSRHSPADWVEGGKVRGPEVSLV